MPNSYPARLERLCAQLPEHGLRGLVLNPGPTLGYLTGLDFHLMERPVLLMLNAAGEAAIVVPQLERLKVAQPPFEMQVFSYTEDVEAWPDAFGQALGALGLTGQTVGGESGNLRMLELEMIRRAGGGTQVVPADEVVAAVRSTKDAAEVEAIGRAVRVAEDALRDLLGTLALGQTEAEVARQLILNLIGRGSSLHLPFPPIVSFGENSANPHASPGERELRRGDLILIDWGARVGGYVSDMTRVFAAGEVSDQVAEIAQVVERANAAGRAAAVRGATAHDVDRATRGVVESAGWGEQFVHRTGHGMGLDAHEAPYIRDGNRVPLRDGHVFTVEPGVYLPSVAGVRIEDDLVMEGDAARSLTSLPRELQIVLQ
jgi:Xaa-Pro dipeptidase